MRRCFVDRPDKARYWSTHDFRKDVMSYVMVLARVPSGRLTVPDVWLHPRKCPTGPGTVVDLGLDISPRDVTMGRWAGELKVVNVYD